MDQDPATLDQLRVLLAIVETGSFSAAGRRLHRVQSAISHAVSAMEEQFGVPLFDRTARRPTLTPAGESVLAVAREVCARADGLRQLAAALNGGEEPMVGVAVDVLYPSAALTRACRAFATRWPSVQLRLFADTLNGIPDLVRDGTCAFGMASPVADLRGLSARHVAYVHLVTVCAPTHPAATSIDALGDTVQIVLSERNVVDETPDQAVLSSRTWRVHDLPSKRALIVDGLGWGNLPLWLVREDLDAGRLVRIQPAAWPPEGVTISIVAATRPDRVLGPAGAWLLRELARGCTEDPSPM